MAYRGTRGWKLLIAPPRVRRGTRGWMQLIVRDWMPLIVRGWTRGHCPHLAGLLLVMAVEEDEESAGGELVEPDCPPILRRETPAGLVRMPTRADWERGDA